MKPRILFFVTEDWYFWSHRLPIARAARNAGFEVIVITRVDQHKELIENEGFKLVPIGLKRSSKNVIREALSLFEIIRIYRREKPDIVHQVAVKPVLYGSSAAWITGIPSMVNALAGLGYVFIADGWKTKALKQFICLAFRLAFSTENVSGIFQNPEDLKSFVEAGIVAKEKTVLIRGSGVDTACFKYRPESVGIPTVVLASRMLWDKGVGDFVDAVRQIKESGAECRALLVGVPDPENPNSISEETLRQWDFEGVVDWVGKRDDMPEVLSKANIVALPTTYGEGVPKILLEAASCGRAIVATDVPGCREIVRHYENGILVPPHDVKALVDALKTLIEDPQRRASMGSRGREIVETEFSEEIVVKQTMELYKKILRNKANVISPL